MKSIGIKYQLRITTLIPVFLVALLLAIFYNGLFGNDLKQHMSRLGEAYIRQLLPAAQYAMLRGDDRTLQGLINASTINPEVKALAFIVATVNSLLIVVANIRLTNHLLHLNSLGITSKVNKLTPLLLILSRRLRFQNSICIPILLLKIF